MYKPTQAGKNLEGILRETLEEISRGKTDLFHRVVAEVLEEVAVPNERADDKTVKTITKPAGLTSVANDD